MSATNSTTYYELPVFIATDKPAWLTDWNGAMNAIDTAIKEALTAGENAQTTANTATSSIATINDSLTTINTSLTTLTSTVTGLTGSVNTINSLIGNGEPTTSDKTLIGAINEIYAMIGGGTEVDADIVAYDNTSSGLTATNVQDAIDELHNSSAIAYDNTTSGLTASNVQSAIDEIAQGGSGGGVDLDLTAHTGTPTITPASNVTIVTGDGRTDIKFALNADKSLGKIYGFLTATLANFASGWQTVATLSNTDLPTRTASWECAIGMDPNNGWFSKLVFNTDGTIDIKLNNTGSTASSVQTNLTIPPCLYSLEAGF